MKLSEKQRELIDDAGWINTSIIIEVQGNDKEHTRNALEKIVERLKEEKGVDVYDVHYDDLHELEGNWFALNTEIKFIAKDFGTLSRIALLYSPAAAEILEPQKELKISVGDAQNILVDISEVVSSLAHTVFAAQGELNLAKKELEAGKAPKNNTES